MSLMLYVKPIEEKPKQVYLAFEFHVNQSQPLDIA